MTKTKEEMAKEYSHRFDKGNKFNTTNSGDAYFEELAFLAGYDARQAEIERLKEKHKVYDRMCAKGVYYTTEQAIDRANELTRLKLALQVAKDALKYYKETRSEIELKFFAISSNFKGADCATIALAEIESIEKGGV